MTWEIFIAFLGAVGAIFALIKPLLDLVKAIARLQTAIESLAEWKSDVKKQLITHEKMLGDHEKRIIKIEGEIHE